MNRHPSRESEPSVIRVRDVTLGDLQWVRERLLAHWGSTEISSLGVWHHADALPALIAEQHGQGVGLVTFTAPRRGADCEVITLSTEKENAGIGRVLLESVTARARAAGCRRVFLTTTNDNLRAIGFYQKRGWSMVAVHRGAMDRARAIKPSIPIIGMNNIPLHDEIEFELHLA